MYIYINMMLGLYRLITDYNYSRLLHVHMQRYNNANCAGTRFYRCLIHMHANWCFQSKCSNISAEGLHFSAFHYYSVRGHELSGCVRADKYNLI